MVIFRFNILSLALYLFSFTITSAKDFYVAPSGNDNNPGTSTKPFATLLRALSQVRSYRSDNPRENIQIFLKEGIFYFTETLVFDLRDSQTSSGTLTISAAPDEKPKLSGSRPLPGGWKRLTSKPERLPQKAQRHVWVANVPAEWPLFRTLFQDGTTLQRARSKGFHQSNVVPIGHPAIDNRNLYLPGEAQSIFADFTGGEIIIIPIYPWVMNFLPIESVNRSSGMLTTLINSTYPLNKTSFGNFQNGTLWFENLLEALDEPGEWVLDTITRKLYLWPVDDQEPGEDIVAPCLTELIRIEGKIDYEGTVDVPVRGLNFRGLCFTQTDRWQWESTKTGWGLQHDWEMFDRPTAMLRFRGAENCSVENCSFVNSGATGVRLDLHSQKIKIRDCEFSYLGGTGVLLAGYGMGTKDVNRDNVISDCEIHHIGRQYWHSVGVWAWQSGHNTIEHNHIYHIPYSGILVTGRTILDREGIKECSKTVRWSEVDRVLYNKAATWINREILMHSRENTVSFNDIHNCMEMLGDGNAIYVSGAGGNNRVINNFIHDITAENINANIRCDDDQEGTFIENNVITRVRGEGFIIKGNNVVRNNIFHDIRAFSPEGNPGTHRRGYIVLPYGRVDGSTIQNNLFVACSTGLPVLSESKGSDNPNESNIPQRIPALLRNCNADFNLYFNSAEHDWGLKYLESQSIHGIEKNSVNADPLFVNAPNDDFRLMPESPALKLGFKPVDLSTAGPRKMNNKEWKSMSPDE